MLVTTAIAQARKLLMDEGGDRWTDDDLLMWLNGGRRQIASVRPDAVATKVDITLVDGSEQAIPATAFKLLNVPNNTGTSKRSITYIETDALNAIDPDWRDAESTGVVEHYTYDEDDPKSFEVYPPAESGKKVRAVVAITPVDIALGDPIDFQQIYEGPLIDWVVYRASSQPTDSADDAQRAANAMSTFMQALTSMTQVDAATKPKRK